MNYELAKRQLINPSYADFLWARQVTRIRDEPKESLRRRLNTDIAASFPGFAPSSGARGTRKIVERRRQRPGRRCGFSRLYRRNATVPGNEAADTGRQ